MARYSTTFDSSRSPDAAFGYLADVRNFAEWDPGVRASVQVDGEGPGPDSAYDVTVNGIPRPLTLRYEVTEYDEPKRIRLLAESSGLVSDDVISVEPAESGSRVTYEAELTLRGALRIFDPALGLVFNRIGDRAAAGLRSALE